MAVGFPRLRTTWSPFFCTGCFLINAGYVVQAHRAVSSKYVRDSAAASGENLLQTGQLRTTSSEEKLESVGRTVFQLSQPSRASRAPPAFSEVMNEDDKDVFDDLKGAQTVSGHEWISIKGKDRDFVVEAIGRDCNSLELMHFTHQLMESLGVDPCHEEELGTLMTPQSCKDPKKTYDQVAKSVVTFADFWKPGSCNKRKRKLHAVKEAKILEHKDGTTLFYHVHIPKTGGTTVANLILNDICAPVSAEILPVEWNFLCTQTCAMGLTDNMLSCHPGRFDFEHTAFVQHEERAQQIATPLGASRIVYVTSLRHGSERLISQWAHEITNGAWLPPAGVANFSNQSLQLFVSGGEHTTPNGVGWIQSCCPWQRNNLQVAELASMDMEHQDVTQEHLEIAQNVLMTGEWLIGFTHCMSALHDGLTREGEALHGFPHVNRAAAVPITETRTPAIALDKETQDMVDAYAYFDNSLYAWALEKAQQGNDPRFTSTC